MLRQYLMWLYISVLVLLSGPDILWAMEPNEDEFGLISSTLHHDFLKEEENKENVNSNILESFLTKKEKIDPESENEDSLENCIYNHFQKLPSDEVEAEESEEAYCTLFKLLLADFKREEEQKFKFVSLVSALIQNRETRVDCIDLLVGLTLIPLEERFSFCDKIHFVSSKLSNTKAIPGWMVYRMCGLEPEERVSFFQGMQLWLEQVDSTLTDLLDLDTDEEKRFSLIRMAFGYTQQWINTKGSFELHQKNWLLSSLKKNPKKVAEIFGN